MTSKDWVKQIGTRGWGINSDQQVLIAKLLIQRDLISPMPS
jgi:hypothetical protein